MGNVEAHDFAPVRADERKILNLSRRMTPKQYVKHLNGDAHESCLTELPWSVRDSVSLYEAMTASFNAITELPVELPLRLPHLSRLDLSHNRLRTLPESFGLLFHLVEIQLQYNRLTGLPDSFLHLVKLEKVDLSFNEIRHLPESIGSMEKLSKLNAAHNKLRKLPLSLGSPLCRVHLLIAKQNRLESPPQAVCEEGSVATLEYLRRMHAAHCREFPLIPEKPQNVFPRYCGNKLEPPVGNPHSAQVQYIQEQTHTTHTTNRIKAPLLPPPDATILTPYQLRDRIIGLIYGAAIGDAIGIACQWMSDDECAFHYTCDNDLIYTNIVQDEHRVLWRQGDWTSNFDIFMVCLESLANWGGVVDELEFAKRLQAWAQHGFPELGDSSGVLTSEVLREVIRQPKFTTDPHGAASTVFTENINTNNHDSISFSNINKDNGSNATTKPAINSNDTPEKEEMSSIEGNCNSAAMNNSTDENHSNGNKVVNTEMPPSSTSPQQSPQHHTRRLSSSSTLSELSLCSHTEVANRLVYISPCQVLGEDNGAVIRAAILGVPNFHQVDEVEGNAIRICKTTHSSPKAIASCVFVSSLVSLLLQGKIDSPGQDQSPEQKCTDCKTIHDHIASAMDIALTHFEDNNTREEFLALKQYVTFESFQAKEPSRLSHTYKPVEAALIALHWPDDYKSFICALTKLSGDSSSNCCVAGAILGCRKGYAQLPHAWVEGLRKRQVTWLNAKINHFLDVMGLP